MIMKKLCGRSVFVPGMVVLLALVGSARAELLPTTGTFKGIYHQDRFGGRHFLFFNIPANLYDAFDKHDGKYIEMDVLKGEQPMVPGNVNIKSIGAVKELTPPDITLTARVAPASPAAGAPFQVIVRARNTGDKPVGFGPGGRILFRSSPLLDVSVAGAGQLRNLVESVPWRRHHILGHPVDHVSKIDLAPGERMTWALSMDQGIPAGQYEIEAGLELEDHDERTPVATWASLDVGAVAAEENLKRTTLSLTHSPFKTGSEWVSVQLHLTNEEGANARAIPQCVDHGKVPLWAGRLHGYTAEGVEVPLTFDYPLDYAKGPPEGAWRPTPIPREGLKMTMTFRAASWFQPAPIKTLTCDILTDRGLETFTITDAFDDRLFRPLPPFGEIKQGVKCRFRAQKQTYTQNEPIRLYWQVANVDQVPVMCRSKDGWQVKIDGKRIKTARNAHRLWGWATEQGPYPPDEYFLDLKDVTLPPGRHSVQLVCKGSGWHAYRNANGAEIPVFKGSLVSNVTHVTIVAGDE